MRNTQISTWKLTKNLKNMENEKHSLQDLDFDEKE